jgi:hypothetical protein
MRLEDKTEEEKNFEDYKKGESNYRISEGMSPTPSWENNTPENYTNKSEEQEDYEYDRE